MMEMALPLTIPTVNTSVSWAVYCTIMEYDAAGAACECTVSDKDLRNFRVRAVDKIASDRNVV